MKEHGFYAAGLKDVVLSDDIEICGDEEGAKNEEFIVANSQKLKAQIYAPEINFYIENGFTVLDNDVLSKNKKELIQLYKLL